MVATRISRNIMAPAPIDPRIVDTVQPRKDTLALPVAARERLEKGGVNLSTGYPYRPSRPLYVDDVYNIRNYDRPHVDPGTRADPEKKALLSAAKQVIHLTKHIGTEIVGLQLKHLTNNQRDELGLLIAERSVVFFRDQDITPQQQKDLGEWFGEIEVHVCCIASLFTSIALFTESISASSPPSAWRERRHCHLACASGDRKPSQFPSTGWKLPLAHRPGPRKTASRRDTSSQ